ncbi:MAG: DUF58 domain-containing protein [Thermoguttaceae bacterium]
MLDQIMLGYQWGSRFMFSEPSVTPLGVSGNLLSRTVGTSLEFMEHREYKPGDDLRRIDWNAYARNDRLAVKLFREEVNPHVELFLDTSCSMDLPDTKKAEAVFALIGFFASAAAESHFTFTLYTSKMGCQKVGRSNLIPTEWDPVTLDAVVSPPEAVAVSPPAWRKRSVRIFLSDLMFLSDPDLLVSQISQGASTVLVLQLLASADAEPPEHGNLRLVDSETGTWMETYVDTAARLKYIKNLSRHQENYHLACRRHGVSMVTVIAEKFLENQIIDDLLRSEFMRQK